MPSKVNVVKIFTSFLDGMAPVIASIEVSITPGLPTFDVIGLCDSSVRESRGRIGPALVSSGFSMPKGHITASITPAYMKKTGTSFDLPIAIGMLIASKQLSVSKDSSIYASGEIGLDGTIHGTPSAALRFKLLSNDYTYSFIAEDEIDAARCFGIKAMAINHLSSLKDALAENKYFSTNFTLDGLEHDDIDVLDFSCVKGQEKAIRGLLIAASGMHNIMLLGSPGCGKTMAGKILSGIMPPLSGPEIGDVYSIMEAAGLKDDPEENFKLSDRRPFRYIYPGMSKGRILGSPNKLMPGELALANHGVLFADEIFEYKKEILEALRVPLEEHVVRMSKDGRNYAFPASFVFVAAGNPCKCGMLYEEDRKCTCTPQVRRNYQNKLSGPIKDRIDIYAEMRSISSDNLTNSASITDFNRNEELKEQVKTAWDMQKERYHDSLFNGTCINADAELFRASSEVVKQAAKISEDSGFSARGFGKILRVGRTIADLEERADMTKSDVFEAGIYRKKDW